MFYLLIGNQIGQMAFPAINLLVRAGQFVTGQLVVEFFFVKTQHVEIAPVVIAVAFGAVFSPHLARCMKTPVPIRQRFNFLVAIQAFVVRHLVPYVVALCTFGDAFEILVRVDQRAGRQLGAHFKSA